jgi:hypothetical protein
VTVVDACGTLDVLAECGCLAWPRGDGRALILEKEDKEEGRRWKREGANARK